STLAPLIAAALIIPLGWRMTFRLITIPALISACILLLFVKERGERADEGAEVPSLRGFLVALRNRNVLAISAVRTAMAFRMGVRAFIPLYFIDVLGLGTGLSSILYSLMIFGSVLGPFFWGYLSDRMRRKPLVIGVLASSSLLFLCLPRVRGVPLLAPLLFLIGFMVQTVVAQNILADSADPAQLDQIFGFYFTLGFTLGSLSSVVFGYVVELFGFGMGFTFIAAVTAISIAPASLIREAARPMQPVE
ncbi:MAG: MFS transporter, partial [Candidatus Bathyarchaeia archaeon]